jgi:hypothetical protein
LKARDADYELYIPGVTLVRSGAKRSVLGSWELNLPSWAEWFEWLALLAPEYKKQTTSAASKVSSWRR